MRITPLDKITFKTALKPVKKYDDFIREQLHQFNIEKIGQEQAFSIYAFDSQKKIIGGLIANMEKQSLETKNVNT